MQRIRQLLASRKLRLLGALALTAVLVLAARDRGLFPRGLPEAGVLVVDLRYALPDKAERTPDGRRSVSAAEILGALDAARRDRRIAGVYLRVGGNGLTLAQAMEAADAVLRLRRANRFAVVHAEAFSAANLGDRVIAAVADEIWIEPGAPGADWQPGAALAAPAGAAKLSRPGDHALWSDLMDQASARIHAAAPRSAASPEDAVARAALLPPTQVRRGPEARAEQSALAWGGAGAAFVDFLTYREALERRAARAPIIALIQAEGIVDMLGGPGPRELAGPVAARIRAAARDGRVKGVIVRISAVSAADQALAQVLGAAEAVRSSGLPVGISFGPVLPLSASSLRSKNVPLYAAGGALVVNVADAHADALAARLHNPWRTADPLLAQNPERPREAAFFERRAVVAAVTADGAAGRAVPPGAVNVLPGETAGAAEAAAAVSGGWRNKVGSLLDLKDRLAAEARTRRGRVPLLVPYEPRPSVWERTVARIADFRRRTEERAEEIIGHLSPADAGTR